MYAIILHETDDISTWKAQWCSLTGLYYVHSVCYFTTFHTLRNYCDKSVQANENHLMKTKRAGVDSIDKRVRKKDKFVKSFSI